MTISAKKIEYQLFNGGLTLMHALNKTIKTRLFLTKYKFIFLILLIGLTPVAKTQAAIVQILHTNDLHSFLDHSLHNPNLGGYARIKSTIDKYKKQASEKGIQTIVVDSGDFLDGNILYYADRARKSFEAFNSIGYDIVALGNHDYLMGINNLNNLLKEHPPKFKLLGANIYRGSYKYLQKYIRRSHTIKIDDVKISFVGITTDNPVYSWVWEKEGLEIKDPIRIAKRHGFRLKNFKRADALIGLTHLGMSRDKELVRKTHRMDLVIGGHSHSPLSEPIYVKNKKDRPVGIVRASSTGSSIGRLLIDVQKKKPLKILEYDLIPTNTAPDPKILKLVKEAKGILNQIYGKKWLSTVVGRSFLSPQSEDSRQRWGNFVAEAMNEASGSDLAVHSANFSGDNYPIGAITRYKLINAHPRFLDFKRKLGWSLYSASINGFFIKSFLLVAIKLDSKLSLAGITYKSVRLLSGKKVYEFYINGKIVEDSKKYSLTIGEGVFAALDAKLSNIDELLVWARHSIKKIDMSIIEAIEQKLKHTPVR